MQTITKESTPATWETRLFREEDKPSLLRLAASHYSKDRDFAKEAYFDWLYGGGPAGRSTVPVAIDPESGEVIGFGFYVPYFVKVGDFNGRCSMGGNAVVRPDWRGRGVFSGIRKIFYADVGENLFNYGFPKPNAIEVHRSGGSMPISRIPLLIRPLKMGDLAEARFGNPALRIAANTAWMVAGNTLFRPRRPHAGGIRITVETCFDEEFDRLWERASGKYEIITRRDHAYLNWRFCNQSFRTYQILAARASGELAGYAVLRSTSLEGIRTGLIMDMLVEPGERGDAAGLLLVEEATRRFEQDRMSMAGCLMFSHTHEYRILRQAGYIDIPVRFAPQAFLLSAKSFSPRTPPEFLTRAERWFISMANHDAV